MSVPDAEPAKPAGLTCVECGYDLRAQPRESRCPECGRPVDDSIAAIELRGVPAHQAGRLRGAAWLLVLANVASFACVGGSLLIFARSDFGWLAWEQVRLVTAAAFLVALVAHGRGGYVMSDVAAQTRNERHGPALAEFVAGLGLLLLSASALLYDGSRGGSGLWAIIFTGFACVTIGSPRFVPFYRDFKRLLVTLERDLTRLRPGREPAAKGEERPRDFWTNDWADKPPAETEAAPLGWTKLVVDGGLTGSVTLALALSLAPRGDGAFPCMCGALILLPIWAIVWFITLLSHLHLAALATQYARATPRGSI